jgi:NAD(P)-dependent dehydrogenase (short-subunit alcohol dehydrogenase family)
LRLEGQVAWISGGASGIGAGVAELFAEEGARVVIADVQASMGQNLVERIRGRGSEALFIETDVGKEEQVIASIAETIEHFGILTTLVNSAAIVKPGFLHELREEDWDQLMSVNVKGMFLSIKHGIPHLRKNSRSYMVNIASISSFVAQADTPAYTTSKYAVLGLSRSIALDYAADGLRCNTVCPGITVTPLLRHHMGQDGDFEGALENRLKRVPTGIAMFPADVAKAVRFFACEDSAGITGTSLVVDGGYTAAAEWETVGTTKFMEESS